MAGKNEKMATSVQRLEDTEKRKQALEKAIRDINKDFGQGAIMRLGERTGMNVETIPTGILSLDFLTGVGGWPKGRIIEVYGPESSGKTTLTLHSIAAIQQMGGLAAFIDVEHAMDPLYAKGLGVDIDNLLVSQPDYGEQALEIMEALVKSSAVDLVVVDSIAALVPRDELEGDMGDSHVGLQARLMSQALRKVAGLVSKSQTVVVFINQLREKIGVMYGSPEVTTGGMALKFYATMRVDVRRKEVLKEGTDIVGYVTRIKVVKNKVAPPFKEALVNMYFGQGVLHEADVLKLAVDKGVVEKSGAWYSFRGERLAQGEANAIRYLQEHSEVMREIESRLKEAHQ